MSKGLIMMCDCGAPLLHVYRKWNTSAHESRIWVCMECGAIYELVRRQEGSA
jgi:hypothetical protein